MRRTITSIKQILLTTIALGSALSDRAATTRSTRRGSSRSVVVRAAASRGTSASDPTKTAMVSACIAARDPAPASRASAAPGTTSILSAVAGLGFQSHPYCQEAIVPVGGECKKVARGCLKGAACFQGTCVKICREAAQCQAKQRCEPIFLKQSRLALPWMAKAAYKGCVAATIAHGAECDPANVPMCEPGNECVGGQCARVCKRDDECPVEKKCHPFVAKVRKPYYRTAVETLFHACQSASRQEGTQCKANHWPLCQRGLRCYYSKCAKLCKTTKDCGTTGKCRRVTRSYGVLKNKKKMLYKVCAPATISEGGKCGSKVGDVCMQKHRCLEHKCVKRCRQHEDCAEEQECSAKGFYKNYKHKARMAEITGDRGDFHFCRLGERKFAPRATYNKCQNNRNCLRKPHLCSGADAGRSANKMRTAQRTWGPRWSAGR